MARGDQDEPAAEHAAAPGRRGGVVNGQGHRHGDDALGVNKPELRPGGLWRLATDWEDYALWQRETLDAHPRFENLHGGWAPRYEARPVTKYEAKGLAQGRRVYDLTYRRLP